NSSGQVVDSSTVAGSGAKLPAALNFTGNINYSNSTSGPARGSGIWWNGTGGITGSGACSDTGTCYASRLVINDGVDASAASNGLTVLEVQDVMGANSKAHRTVGNFIFNMNAVTADTSHQYVALGTVAQASVNNGGSSGAGNGASSLFGFNPYCRLLNGA